MKVKDYPYGQPTKRLKEAVKWLNKNKAKITRRSKKHREILDEDIEIDENDPPIFGDAFDYPYYWNMPKSISYKLDPDEVDWIQDQTYEWWQG